MAKAYPTEFREDVLRVVANRDPGVTIEQIAKDFGIHPSTLDGWRRQQHASTGTKSDLTASERDELKETRKRNRLLEQEVEVLRRAAAYLSQANLPGKGGTRS